MALTNAEMQPSWRERNLKNENSTKLRLSSYSTPASGRARRPAATPYERRYRATPLTGGPLELRRIHSSAVRKAQKRYYGEE
jgi:hypothetical protein